MRKIRLSFMIKKQLFIKEFVLLVLIIVLSACCSAEKSYSVGSSNEDTYFADEESLEPVMRMESSSESQLGSGLVGTVSDDSVEQPVERKRIYNGDASLVVEEVEETKLTIEQLAIDSGGYVTQIYQQSITIKVPFEYFHEIYENILLLGDVQSRNISTYDVTDYYADTSARLLTAEKTRERLQLLLTQSTDPEERAKILREIGRLTEEIELIKNRLQTLDANIAYSTISINLRPRLEQNISQQNIPFDWIARLYPLSSASDRLRANLTLELGEEFAIFSRANIFHAENSKETSIMVSTVENQPQGDEQFWQIALLHHMSDYYKEAKSIDMTIGNKTLLGIEFISKDREPFRYFVGIVADGDKLHVFEIFSPDIDETFDSIYSSINEGEIR